MYAGIESLVFHPIFNGHAQCIMDFDDRWQEPLSGGYSDCQLLARRPRGSFPRRAPRNDPRRSTSWATSANSK